jgi:hypothetical protein
MIMPGVYNERVNETPLQGDGHGPIDGRSFAAHKERARHSRLVAGRACQALRRESQDDFRHRERFSEACAAATHRSQAALGIANGTAIVRVLEENAPTALFLHQEQTEYAIRRAISRDYLEPNDELAE